MFDSLETSFQLFMAMFCGLIGWAIIFFVVVMLATALKIMVKILSWARTL